MCCKGKAVGKCLYEMGIRPNILSCKAMETPGGCGTNFLLRVNEGSP
jgi:hypothetical protein